MKLGQVQLDAPYVPGAGIVATTDLTSVLFTMDAYPSRARLYRRDDLTYTGYTLLAAGGGRLVLGPVLEGVDRAYNTGDLVWLQCNLLDVAAGNYLLPAFTSFSISSLANPIEVGATVSGPQTFVWTTSNSINVAANSISIVDVTGSMTLATGLANTGSDTITLSAITETSATNYVWSITGKNTQGASFSRTYTEQWLWRVYAGTNTSVTLTANQIKALSDASGLQSGFAGTYTFADVFGYKYFSYPDNMGDVVSFVDSNTGFPVDMATVSDNAFYSNVANGWYYGIVNVINTNGVATNYRLYRTTNQFQGNSPLFSMRVS